MKILAVTGATGKKSGSAFVRQLVNNTNEIKEMFPDGVRLLVRSPEKLNGIEKTISHCEIRGGIWTMKDISIIVLRM
jgi:uncharacterized protein YbjT (DUF2867 family)